MKEQNPLLKYQETLNPYFDGLALIARRMLWDLKPQSWISRARLKAYKNMHQGKKAVILCNGPSLLKTDFNSLKNVFTFGLNKINLLFDKNDFRPSCIVAVNPHVIEQNVSFYNSTDIPLFLDRIALHQGIKFRENVALLHSPPSYVRRFARDVSVSLYYGYTVTFVAIQLAYHMGLNEVALIGCDHNFATKGEANKTVIAGESDPNHFDPNYFAGGVKWDLPDLFESEVAYAMAKNMFEATGRQIVNCTVGGKLEVFNRMSLEEFVGGKIS